MVAYLAEEAGVPGTPEQINADVVELDARGVRARAAAAAGRRRGRAAPRGARSRSRSRRRRTARSSRRCSARRDRRLLRATVSSEEVPRGKPAPDVYLEAARRLGVAPGTLRCSRGLALRDPLRPRRGDARRSPSRTRAIRPTPRRSRSPTTSSLDSSRRLEGARRPTASKARRLGRDRGVEVLAEHREDRHVAQRPAAPPGSRRRSVASSMKPSLRGTPRLASFRDRCGSRSGPPRRSRSRRASAPPSTR